MPMQRSVPVTLLIAVACLVGLLLTFVILGGIASAALGLPPEESQKGLEVASELFGIGTLVAWIGTFKLLTFNPPPRRWGRLVWWTLLAIAVPTVARVFRAL